VDLKSNYFVIKALLWQGCHCQTAIKDHWTTNLKLMEDMRSLFTSFPSNDPIQQARIKDLKDPHSSVECLY
jgi:hypothetical protein